MSAKEEPLSSADSGRSEPSLKRVLRPVLATVAFVFVVSAAYDLYVSWDGESVQVDLLFFASSVVVAGVAMTLQLVAWRALIKHICGVTMPARASARLYLDSQMARYTPGKVGLPVVRIAGSQGVGVKPRVMASALFVEVVSWVGVGSAVGGVVLGFLPAAQGLSRELSLGSLLVGVAAVVGLAVVVLVDRAKLPIRVRELAGGDGEGPLVPWMLPLVHFLHFATWIVSGALVALSVGAEWQVALVAGALLCLAIVGGFVALLAPAGAGVREAILAVGLAPAVGPTVSVSIGILARVASLASDVVLWGWFRLRRAQGVSADSPDGGVPR